MEHKLFTTKNFLPNVHDNIIQVIDKIIAFEKIRKINFQITQDEYKLAEYTAFFEKLNLKTNVMGTPNILPRDKPWIIVSNHPFGILEVILLHEIFSPVRKDIKFVAGELIPMLSGHHDQIIVAHNFSKKTNVAANKKTLTVMLDWLHDQHVLWLQPSGQVSTLNFGERLLSDPPWHRSLGLLQRKTKALVIPVFIEGRNSLLFQLLHYIHPRSATVLMVKEVFKQAKKVINIHVGSPIADHELAKLKTHEAITDYIRKKTYALAD